MNAPHGRNRVEGTHLSRPEHRGRTFLRAECRPVFFGRSDLKVHACRTPRSVGIVGLVALRASTPSTRSVGTAEAGRVYIAASTFGRLADTRGPSGKITQPKRT